MPYGVRGRAGGSHIIMLRRLLLGLVRLLRRLCRGRSVAWSTRGTTWSSSTSRSLSFGILLLLTPVKQSTTSQGSDDEEGNA